MKTFIIYLLVLLTVSCKFNFNHERTNSIEVERYSWKEKETEETSQYHISIETNPGACADATYNRILYPTAYDFNSFAETKDAWWFGSAGSGIIRLDKKTNVLSNWKTTNSALSDNEIKYLHTDKEGNLWITTRQNLFKVVNKDHFITISFPNSGSSDGFTKIDFDKDNHLWATYSNDTIQLLLNYTNDKITVYESDPVMMPRIIDFTIDKSNTLWLSTIEGLAKFSDQGLTIDKNKNGAEKLIKVMPDNSLLLLGSNTSYLYKNGQYKKQLFPHHMHYAIDSKSNLYFPGRGNSLDVAAKDWIGVETFDALKSSKITSLSAIKEPKRIFIDQSDNIFIPSRTQGIFRLTKDTITIAGNTTDISSIKTPFDIRSFKDDQYLVNFPESLDTNQLYNQPGYSNTAIDINGNYWSLSGKTITNYGKNYTSNTQYDIEEELTKAGIAVSLPDVYYTLVPANDVLYMIGSHSVVSYANKKWHYYPANPNMSGDSYEESISHVFLDKTNRLWIQRAAELLVLEQDQIKSKLKFQNPYNYRQEITFWKVMDDNSIWLQLNKEGSLKQFVMAKNGSAYTESNKFLNVGSCMSDNIYVRNFFIIAPNKFLVQTYEGYLFFE